MYISFYFYFSNLFLPPKKQKHSPIDDICNEKRRKIDDDDVKLSPPRNKNEISNAIEKQVLEILNTPLVEKKIASPSITTYSSILKVYYITLKSIVFFYKLKQKPNILLDLLLLQTI